MTDANPPRPVIATAYGNSAWCESDFFGGKAVVVKSEMPGSAPHTVATIHYDYLRCDNSASRRIAEIVAKMFGAEEPVEWRQAEMPTPVSLGAGGDQPGACAPVPLPETPIYMLAVNGVHTHFTDGTGASAEQMVKSVRIYRPGAKCDVKRLWIADQLRAYGEACAAQWKARAAELSELCHFQTGARLGALEALAVAERERDELRARAEAAEAKIAEMEGRRDG
jgi:hypothetical protein